MPWSLRRLGRKIKSVFRSRSREGRRNGDHGEAIDGVATTSSAPPSTAAGLLPPVVVVTPTRSMLDVTENANPVESQGAGGHGRSPPVAYHSIDLSGHRNPPERLSFEAASLGVQPQSSNAPVTGIALSESHQQPVPRSGAVPNLAQSPPTPLPHEHTLSPSPVSTTVAPSTSVFSGARDFSVSNLNVNTSFVHSKSLFEYLNPYIAHGAAHDSDERWNAPACHEETRVAVREEIMSWIKHGERDEEPKRIMWLSGPAGCGKSAIAGSVAETCKKEGLLAATFFFSSFSGSVERSSKRGLIPTLAYHMSQNQALSRFRSHLHAAVDLQPEIFRKNLKEQAKSLILEPFRKVHDQESRAGWPKVIIIDGLDEVVAAQHPNPTDQQPPSTSENDQVEILHVLFTLSKDTSFPFRIFVASRPESNITHFFATDAPNTAVSLFLDSKHNPDADVERFLVSKFAQIRRRSGISNQSWPGQPALDHLVEMSSGQFIVPTTIIRWIEAGVPQHQLDEVLQFALPNSGTENPFATLDALYRRILQRAHNPKDDLHLVVKWIDCMTSGMYTPLGQNPPHVDFWRQFLETVEGELNYRLAPITSLISVPPPSDTSSPITIYHKSLTDFLSSPARCGDLYVEDAAHTSFVSERIFVVLKNKGPIVLLPSLPELATFLHSFFGLRLLLHFPPEVLTSLSSRSKDELASCDVAWWTGASLSKLLYDGSSLSQDGCHTRSLEGWGSHPYPVQTIYCNIHQAMGCGSEAPSLGQDAARRAQSSKCHEACVRWRTGILAKAKELGWCVHELEGVGLDELEHLHTIIPMFKSPQHHSCNLCRTASTGT